MKLGSRIIVVSLVFSISGCGWFGVRDRSQDYLLSEEITSTYVPAEIVTSPLGQLYPIPALETSEEQLTSFDVPRPQPASVNTFEKLVKIQSFDEKRWVLINISPSELWPRLRNVLNRNGVPSSRAQGSEGIIETVWVSFNSDEKKSHRFRFNVTPGVQIDSTEIRVVHNQVIRGDEAKSDWPDTSDDDQRELDMLTLIANDLAGADNFASVSLLAQEIGGTSKVSIVTPEVSPPFILMKLEFDRSWASVLYSAERGGFTLIDQNRTGGEMLVNFSEPSEEKAGFFSRLFGSSSTVEEIEFNYRILLIKSGPDVEVRIEGADGEQPERALLLNLLAVLRSNLS